MTRSQQGNTRTKIPGDDPGIREIQVVTFFLLKNNLTQFEKEFVTLDEGIGADGPHDGGPANAPVDRRKSREPHL